MTYIARSRSLLTGVLAVTLVCCQGFRDVLRDPAGDDRVFEGDPTAFVGKEVILQFRWGDPAMYGQAIPCIILKVESETLVVRALSLTEGSYPLTYSRLEQLGQLSRVEGESDVFRVRRNEICRIFEPTTSSAGE